MGIGVEALFCQPNPGYRTTDQVLFDQFCAGMELGKAE